MMRSRGGRIGELRWRTAAKHEPRRYFDGLETSPQLITMQAIAADVMIMRLQRPSAHPTSAELAGALILAASLVDELEGDERERELLRIAALAVRMLEETKGAAPPAERT